MSYAEVTFKDENPVKRWLQQQRLTSAIELVSGSQRVPRVICDFGAGNGELCKVLAERYPRAALICYEPAPGLLHEAKENLRAIPNVEFSRDVRSIAPASVDLVFCLEVFEHLPPAETRDALIRISDLLQSEGEVVIGLPVEVGVPALYKGIFRMSRRLGAFDANVKNVLLSFLGYPPRNRPTRQIAPGLNYHFEHTGFDFRRFKEVLCEYFRLIKVATSPFAFLGPWLMPEVYFVAEKSDRSRDDNRR